MPVDKFGRSITTHSTGGGSSPHLLSSYRHGFILTGDGNIDVENLKMCNVKDPTDKFDCANKQYVDNADINLMGKINTIEALNYANKQYVDTSHANLLKKITAMRKIIQDNRKFVYEFKDLNVANMQYVNDAISKVKDDFSTVLNKYSEQSGIQLTDFDAKIKRLKENLRNEFTNTIK